jgi:hypothetical protein
MWAEGDRERERLSACIGIRINLRFQQLKIEKDGVPFLEERKILEALVSLSRDLCDLLKQSGMNPTIENNSIVL